MNRADNSELQSFSVGERRIGPGLPVFVIAEIGNNHNGDFDRAIELIDVAKKTGADCAKFQMRKLEEVYRAKSLNGSEDDLAVEYTLDLLRRFELSPEQHEKLKQYCDQVGLRYLCTPWDPTSCATLAKMGVEAFKVASADLTNLPLIDCMLQYGVPLIVSTGMSTTSEIRTTVDFLNKKKAEFALLHCQSTYPAAFHNINLSFLATLRKLHPIVGYSGHERGTAVTAAAVALGATIVERHLTLDRTMEGPDHAASLEPEEFGQLVQGIREVELALGAPPEDDERVLTQGELINRENLAKSLVAAKPIAPGDVIGAESIEVRSPGQGLSPQSFDLLLGKVARREMSPGDFFYPSDLGDQDVQIRDYAFHRPWGVPIRYHDLDQFLSLCKPDLVEFHLSYQDMDRNPGDYFAKDRYDIQLAVHAPELLRGSKLLDLATPDELYRRFSIDELQRVIDVTRELKKWFPNTARPVIIANVGGFSMDAPFSVDRKKKAYEIFSDSLKEIDDDGVEIIPQTMAPFPWHFGGQRFQNMFIEANELRTFCERHDLRMCLDVSHSFLAANHFGWDFYEQIEILGPVVAHLHLGDASGVDGEGLQVGAGGIDFTRLGSILSRVAPVASFIPEIWQGHKNAGEGFWIALDRLEKDF